MKLKILISACAVTLAACTAGPNPTEKFLADDPFIGKDFWVPAISLCETPSIVEKCTWIMGTPDVHLKIDGNKYNGVFLYHVALDDGRTGYVLSEIVLRHGTEMDPAECKRRGEPRIGMTYKQVEATCWGKPKDVNRTQTAGGTDDQLVYNEDHYVYLRNGIVTAVQSGSGRSPKAK
jgi:hypothetical protein